MDAETLSVVVTTRNRLPMLERVLAALLADPLLDELLVVDDGSTDGTREAVEERTERNPVLRLVEGNGVGVGWARTRGAEEARGDVVLFLDDDVVPRGPIVEGHLRHHRACPGALVCGYNPIIVPAGASATVRFQARLYEEWVGSLRVDPETRIVDTTDEVFYLWASQFSVRRADLAKLPVVTKGSLDVTRHDDHEFSLRWHRAGRPSIFDRELVADHYYERSLEQFCRDNREHGRGTVMLHVLHPDLLGPIARGAYERPGRGRAYAAYLRATDRPRVFAAAIAWLKSAVRVSEALHLARLAEAALRVLAITEQRRGVREQVRVTAAQAGQVVAAEA